MKVQGLILSDNDEILRRRPLRQSNSVLHYAMFGAVSNMGLYERMKRCLRLPRQP